MVALALTSPVAFPAVAVTVAEIDRLRGSLSTIATIEADRVAPGARLSPY